MRWMALGLGIALAATALAWALVTTGHWPLDDRTQPATGLYALNGGLGRWLLDHGGEVPPDQGRPTAPAGTTAEAGGGGLTPSELAAVQQALRADPRFRDRHRYTPVPAAASGRG